jgi:hypothetical protein
MNSGHSLRRERHEKLRAAKFHEVAEDGAFNGQPDSEPVEQGETDTRLGAGGRRFGTTARNVDGGYVVNGRKFFVSLAGCALYSFPGEWDPMGMRVTVSRDMVLQDVFVPDDAEVPPSACSGQCTTPSPTSS